MNSCLYVGQVRHRRFLPHTHEFSYGLFMMYVDLEELPNLFKRYWFWSAKKPNLAWFDRKQHTGPQTEELAVSVRKLVEKETGKYPSGPVRLLTHFKYFGFCFNPVSFYYCFDSDGETLQAIVAEINNTPWGEQHCYVLQVRGNTGRPHKFEFDKEFHVSPFNSMSQQYDWRFIDPTDVLATHMNVLEDNQLKFDATMTLKRKEINGKSLAQALIQFPFITVKVVAAIYYQALKLWLKRTPFYSHPAKQEAPITVKKS